MEPKPGSLADEFIKILSKYHYSEITSVSPEQLKLVNRFIQIFLETFTDKTFEASKENQRAFVLLNPIIANLAELSESGNTDHYISKLIKNNTPDFRLLSLYSCRNITEINYKELLSIDKELLSSWYWSFFETDDYSTENSIVKIDNHIDNIELFRDILVLPEKVQNITFISTYASQKKDKLLKAFINGKIKEKYRYIAINNKPDKKDIAVFSRYFFPGHSVYRCSAEYVKSLAADYNLTFITPSDSGLFYRDEIFKNTLYIDFNSEKIALSEIVNNNFSLIYYPDIGQSPESVYLSNIRIAPVQVTGQGHPVSTFGSEIDYFINGSESEDPRLAEENYSEKLILLPGVGLFPSYPAYSPKKLKKAGEKFVIICAWSAPKINYYHLLSLKEILEQSVKNIFFKFFIMVSANVSFLIYKRNIEKVLGKENVEVIKYTPYDKYMEAIETGDLVLDSFPFGGYTTIIDSLFLNKPVITLEGTKAYNRFAGALLRKAGLPELIAFNKDDFISKTVTIINNNSYYSSILDRLATAELEKTIFDRHQASYFKKAIDFIVYNHSNLKDNKVISIF